MVHSKMKIKDTQKFAKLILEEMGGCFIPSHCLDPPIHPLNQDGKVYMETYRAINKERAKSKKWFLKRTMSLLKRINKEI